MFDKYAAGLLLFFSVARADAQPAAAPPPFASEMDAFRAADRAHPQRACGILFVGSSSIRMWTSLSADMAPYRVINRGFGGSTIADVNANFDRAVLPYRPKAIFLYAGDNDLDAGKPETEVLRDFDTFLAKKRQAFGTTPVYFISIKPSRLRLAQLPQQTRVNQAVLQLARRRTDLHYIDVATPMLDHGKPRDVFQADGLHMAGAGYAIWRAVIRPEVAKAAKRPGTCGVRR